VREGTRYDRHFHRLSTINFKHTLPLGNDSVAFLSRSLNEVPSLFTHLMNAFLNSSSNLLEMNGQRKRKEHLVRLQRREGFIVQGHRVSFSIEIDREQGPIKSTEKAVRACSPFKEFTIDIDGGIINLSSNGCRRYERCGVSGSWPRSQWTRRPRRRPRWSRGRGIARINQHWSK